MSLFIVSQNKKQIKKLTDSIEIKNNIKFNPNDFNGIKEPKYISSSIYVDGQCFATYSTEEQTIKIVQEIKQELENSKNIYNKSIYGEPKSKVSLKANKDTVESNEPYIKGLDVDIVYEMPQIMPNKAVESPRKHESPLQ